MEGATARERLNKLDLKFIVKALAPAGQGTAALQRLVADEEVRDDLLDHPRLLSYIISHRHHINISLSLFFYVMVRHALRQYQIDDRTVTDYVASLLVEFPSTARAQRIAEPHQKNYTYFFDMLYDVLEASSQEAFLLHRHMGDHALFVAGVFPDFVYHREHYHPPAPGFEYYEHMGSVGYQRASQHSLAERYQLVQIFEILARHFRDVRLALNYMTDEYLHLDRKKMSMDRVQRRLEHFAESRRRNLQ